MTCSMMLFVSPDVSFCYLRCKEMCQFTFCYFTLQYLRFLSFYILKCCILHTVITFYQLISLHLTHYTDLLRNRFHFWGVSPASPLWTSQAVSNELCHSVLRSLVWTSKSRSMARSLGLWQVLSCAMFEHVCENFCQMILIKLIEPLKTPLTEEGSLWACSKGKDIDWWNFERYASVAKMIAKDARFPECTCKVPLAFSQ